MSWQYPYVLSQMEEGKAVNYCPSKTHTHTHTRVHIHTPHYHFCPGIYVKGETPYQSFLTPLNLMTMQVFPCFKQKAMYKICTYSKLNYILLFTLHKGTSHISFK